VRVARFILTVFIFVMRTTAASTDRAHPLTWFEATDNPSRFIARTPSYRIEVTSRGFKMPGGLEMRLEGAAQVEGSLASERPISISWLALEPSQRRRVEGSAETRFHNIRPGIDLHYHYDRGLLEYDLLLAPRASLTPVRIESNGDITLLADGSLRIRRGAEEIDKRAPVAWQQVADQRQTVAVRYQHCGPGICFALGPHDSSKSLVIDPVISFATYFGTTSPDSVSASATDKNGNLYIAGSTDVTTFPFMQPSLPEFTPTTSGNYLAKFSLGGQLVFAALLPLQAIQAIAIDAAGSTYALSAHLDIAGQSTLPGPSWIPTSVNGSQVLLKINAPGNDLIYATFTPGTAGAMLPTPTGELYLAGNFTSPPSKAFSGTLLKVSSGGTEALVSAHLETPLDVPTALAYDPAGNVIVGGMSASTAARSANAFQPRSRTRVEFGSRDGGQTWTPVSPDLRTTSVWQDQAVAGRIWAWSSASGSLLASTDFGATWKTQADFRPASHRRVPRFNAIPAVVNLVTVPGHPDLLFLVTANGTRRSTDAGKTWTTIRTGFELALAVDPHNTNNLLAQEIYDLVLSRDGGKTWTGLPFQRLSVTTSFAVVPGSNPTQVLLSEYNYGLLRFDFGSGNVATVSSSLFCLEVVPSTMSGVVYLEVAAFSGQSLFRVDNGQTLTPLGSAGPRLFSAANIVPDPVNSNVLYVATYPIPMKSSDGGQTWQPLGQLPAPATDSGTALLVNPSDTSQLLVFRPPNGNAFLTIFKPDLSGIVASTWLGGDGDETVTALTTGTDRLITVSGTTTSTDIAQTYGGTHADGSTDTRSGQNDIYLARLTPDLSTKTAFRLLGGNNYESGSAVHDIQGNILVGGFTYSSDFPVVGQPLGTATQSTTAPNWFFTSLDSNLNSLYSSFLNLGNSSMADFSRPGPTPDGRVWIAGDTQATNLPTTPGAPYARPQGFEDIYIMLFDWRK